MAGWLWTSWWYLNNRRTYWLIMKCLKVSLIEFSFRKKLFLTLLLIGFTYLFSNSQSHTIKFNNLTIKEGLSQSTVNCILQDKSNRLITQQSITYWIYSVSIPRFPWDSHASHAGPASFTKHVHLRFRCHSSICSGASYRWGVLEIALWWHTQGIW